jgi:ABC-2 type transport system ATP-binding protein
VIDKSELPELEREHAVISTKLLAGRTVVHVNSAASPCAGFNPVEADLKDVYFSTMAGSR